MRLIKLLPCALISSLVYAGHPNVSRDLDDIDRNSTAHVIVQFVHQPTGDQHFKVTSRGGTWKRDLSFVNAGSYSIPASMLDDLASDPEVAFVSPDRPVHGTLDSTTAAVNAAAAWTSNLTGAGIGVAVIDSGLNDNAD